MHDTRADVWHAAMRRSHVLECAAERRFPHSAGRIHYHARQQLSAGESDARFALRRPGRTFGHADRGLHARAPQPAEEPAATQPAPAKSGWTSFAEGFIESRFKADPIFAVQSGRHEFDGQMPDWSRVGPRGGRRRVARAARRSLRGFDRGRLTPEHAVRAPVPRVGDRQRNLLAGDAESPFRNPAWYLERLDPSMYLTREYAPLTEAPARVSRLRARHPEAGG